MKYSKAIFIGISVAAVVVFPLVALAESPLREEAVNYRLKGYQHQSSGELDQAITQYQKAIALDPSYPTPHNDLGVVYEQQDKLDDAERAYRRALELDPGYLSAHSNLALLYEKRGQFDLAMQHWQQRASLGKPDDVWAQRAQERVALLKSQLGMPASATPAAQAMGASIAGATSAAVSSVPQVAASSVSSALPVAQPISMGQASPQTSGSQMASAPSSTAVSTAASAAPSGGSSAPAPWSGSVPTSGTGGPGTSGSAPYTSGYSSTAGYTPRYTGGAGAYPAPSGVPGMAGGSSYGTSSYGSYGASSYGTASSGAYSSIPPYRPSYTSPYTSSLPPSSSPAASAVSVNRAPSEGQDGESEGGWKRWVPFRRYIFGSDEAHASTGSAPYAYQASQSPVPPAYQSAPAAGPSHGSLMTQSSAALRPGGDQYQLGIQYYKDGNYALAWDAFRKAQAADPENPEIKRYLERTEQNLQQSYRERVAERKEEAFQEFGQEHARVAQMIEDHYIRGQVFFQQGAYARAKGEFEQILATLLESQLVR